MPGDEKITGLFTSTGEVIRAADHGRGLPAKQPEQHRWVATVSFFLSPGQARAAHSEGNRVLMDGSNLLAYGIGCWDCEQEWTVANGTRCPAGDEWKPA